MLSFAYNGHFMFSRLRSCLVNLHDTFLYFLILDVLWALRMILIRLLCWNVLKIVSGVFKRT